MYMEESTANYIKNAENSDNCKCQLQHISPKTIMQPAVPLSCFSFLQLHALGLKHDCFS
jgi:hypothetical protein